MNGYQKFVFVLLSLVAASRSSPLNPCRDAPQGAFVNDPSSCDGFFSCINGAPTAGKCPAGYYYNPQNGMCDYPSNVVCNPEINQCEDQKNGTFIDEPDTCSGFYICLDGQSFYGICPNDYWFNGKTGACDIIQCTPQSPVKPPNVPPIPPKAGPLIYVPPPMDPRHNLTPAVEVLKPTIS